MCAVYPLGVRKIFPVLRVGDKNTPLKSNLIPVVQQHVDILHNLVAGLLFMFLSAHLQFHTLFYTVHFEQSLLFFESLSPNPLNSPTFVLKINRVKVAICGQRLFVNSGLD